jgi:hypothetical protein
MEKTREELIAKLRRVRGLCVMGWREPKERWDEVYQCLGSTWKNGLVASGWWDVTGEKSGSEAWGDALGTFHQGTECVFAEDAWLQTLLYDVTERLIQEAGRVDLGADDDGEA